MSSYLFSKNMNQLKPSAIREILKMSSDRSVISLAAGNPAPEAFPVEQIREIASSILQEDPILALQYSVTEGYTPFRDSLKELLRTRYHIEDPDGDVVVVSGAQQGIEMSCKVFCDRGDTVLVENPSFVGSLNAFRSYGIQLVGVPMEDDGISVEKLEVALKENKSVKVLYVIPNFQNPSGMTMSWEKRKAVYELACRYNVIIIEDNPYGDLRFDGEDIPAIKTLDRAGRVIYCGSFSKVISPGLRVGYVAANKEIISRIVVAKQCEDVHTTIFSQLICERFLNNCDFDAHIAHLRSIYAKKSSLMLSGMDRHFSANVRYMRPQGGLFVWCTLPVGSDMLRFCQKAVAEYKVAVVPGTAFTADENEPTTSFRINYSTPTDENITKGIEILGRLTHEFA